MIIPPASLLADPPPIRPAPAAGRRGQAVRRALALALVVAAALGVGVAAIAAFHAERSLSVGTIRLSVDPGHRGALEVYVPVVDWGARFHAVRLPARLRIDVRSVNREMAARVAGGARVDVQAVRHQARDAVASYLRSLLGVVALTSLAAGLLAAFALRSSTGPRLRALVATAAVTTLAGCAAVALLLPPRGPLDDPEYFAHGADIPAALRALETARASADTLDEELNAQLTGLARLLSAPARRTRLGGLPRLTVASDLHNNVVALEALERAAEHGPLFFPGDLSDRGSPLEARLLRRVVRAGHPFLFVSGNHDSDTLVRRLAREGAIVLTRRGRLLPDGRYGEMIVHVAGLRVAGYADPFERRAARGYRGAADPRPSVAQQQAFADWLRPLVGRVDVVMVHQPALAQAAIAELRDRPPPKPIAFFVGHTHVQRLETSANLVVLNSGTVGAGGTGNLDEGSPIGLAVLIYRSGSGFDPLAADLVEIDPGSGSATAERRRLELDDTPRARATLVSPPVSFIGALSAAGCRGWLWVTVAHGSRCISA